MHPDARVLNGDSLEILPLIPPDSYDAVITDPPYELGFMGKSWDSTGIAYNVELWSECLRVLKPGGHLLAFGGARTWHRLAVAIEDAGFEMRDSIAWLYGSGFPKSLDVSKAIDKAAGAEREVVGLSPHAANRSADMGYHGSVPGEGLRSITAPATDAAQQWRGWGTALKPGFEPIVVARKPFKGTVAANVLAHGTGALNIDSCRVPGEPWKAHDATGLGSVKFFTEGDNPVVHKEPHAAGRWPTNVVLDSYMANEMGEPAKFFPTFKYQAKAPKSERPIVDGVSHPTVKPLELMRWLVKLVTPPGGCVLDPFAGSGATVEACILEGIRCDAIEQEPTYIPLIQQRIQRCA